MKKFMTLAAIFAATMISFSSCEKNPDAGKNAEDPDVCQECGKNPCECEPDFVSAITVDGDFSDWNTVTPVTATCAANAKWTALQTVKVYTDEMYIHVYFEFSEDEIVDMSSVPFHVYINEDASEATGNDQFLGQGGQDWMLEGWVFSEGAFCSYDPGIYSYDGAEDTLEWAYTSVLGDSQGVASGAGNGNKYEFSIVKEMMMGVNLASTFTIGFDIQQSWNSVGVLPNTDVTDDNSNGSAPMLSVQAVM